MYININFCENQNFFILDDREIIISSIIELYRFIFNFKKSLNFNHDWKLFGGILIIE